MGSCCDSENSSILHIDHNNSKQPLLRPRTNEERENMRKRAAKRQKAVAELLETEKTYVERMNMCIQYFFEPMLLQKKVISASDHKILFSDYKIIYSLNEQFLEDLKNATKNDIIGKQFVQFCPYFRMYQNYLNNYDSSMDILSQKDSKKAFKEFCDEQRQQCNGQQLQSFLILPIQRLPRYKMCLTEIIKNTEEAHTDIQDLEDALQMVDETTTLINTRMKEYEARQKVRAVERRFSHRMRIVQPSRSFVYEGHLTKVNKSGNDQLYAFLLFTDVLMYASGGRESMKLHEELPIDKAFYIVDVRNHEKYGKCAFEIHSSVKSFIVHTENNSIKVKWMKEIQNVVSTVARVNLQSGKAQQRELAAPLMIPDGWSSNCMLKECGKPFTTFNRRHHCRFCGKLVCGKCSGYRLASKVHKNKVVKPVCVKCYNTWSKIYTPKKGASVEEDDESDEDDKKTNY